MRAVLQERAELEQRSVARIIEMAVAEYISPDNVQPATRNKAVRCAIYTRVSTDHRLEQDVNSLDKS